MKATEAKLLSFLEKAPQFIIPIYQRTYSWTLAEVESEIHDAIVFHLEGLREDGLPVPVPASQVEYVEIAA